VGGGGRRRQRGARGLRPAGLRKRARRRRQGPRACCGHRPRCPRQQRWCAFLVRCYICTWHLLHAWQAGLFSGGRVGSKYWSSDNDHIHYSSYTHIDCTFTIPVAGTRLRVHHQPVNTCCLGGAGVMALPEKATKDGYDVQMQVPLCHSIAPVPCLSFRERKATCAPASCSCIMCRRVRTCLPCRRSTAWVLS
jgi:hypothetical protein